MTPNLKQQWLKAVGAAVLAPALLSACATGVGPNMGQTLVGSPDVKYTTTVNGKDNKVPVVLKSDHRGVLYYTKDGKSTGEPVRLSNDTCAEAGVVDAGEYAMGGLAGYGAARAFNLKTAPFIIAGIGVVKIFDYFSERENGNRAQTELQCLERHHWEVDHGYRLPETPVQKCLKENGMSYRYYCQSLKFSN